jgi:hypothetical protein
VLASEFGDHVPFDMTSDTMLGVARHFSGFTQALEEVKNARIYSGIHFRTACDDGQALGIKVANYILENAFQRAN